MAPLLFVYLFGSFVLLQLSECLFSAHLWFIITWLKVADDMHMTVTVLSHLLGFWFKKVENNNCASFI